VQVGSTLKAVRGKRPFVNSIMKSVQTNVTCATRRKSKYNSKFKSAKPIRKV
jgi:hypothetical protein